MKGIILSFPGMRAKLCDCGRIIHVSTKVEWNDPAICSCGRVYVVMKGEVLEVRYSEGKSKE